MSPLFTRTLFASASVALTLAMVSASAPATASQGDVRHMVVKIGDLNLGSAAGRHALANRLDAAADAVCPANAAVDNVAVRRCRTAAIDQAHADIARAGRGAAS